MTNVARATHVLLFAAVALVAVVVFLPATLLLGAMGEGLRLRTPGEWTHAIAGFFVRLGFRCVPGWRIRVEGLQHLPPASATAVFVANHRSLFDILLMFTLRVPFRFLSKEENFRIPGFGTVGRLARHVALERPSKEDRQRALDECVRVLRAGSSLCVFPEGTRARGMEYLPFRQGAFRAATDTGVPVVPVVLCGTERMFGLRSGLPIPGDIRVRVLPLEFAERHRSPEAFAAHVRQRMLDGALNFPV